MYRCKSIRDKETAATPLDGRDQLRREFRLAVRQSFERQVPRPYAFIALRHIGHDSFGVYDQPPRRHRCREQHLSVFFGGISQVVAFAQGFIRGDILRVRLVGQLFHQCVLFSRGEIHEVVDSGNKDVPLLTLSLRSELVMTAQNIQCTVEVQPQSISFL